MYLEQIITLYSSISLKKNEKTQQLIFALMKKDSMRITGSNCAQVCGDSFKSGTMVFK